MTPDSLDYALVRYAAECRVRHDLAPGFTVDLGAWLAGWFSAVHGLPRAELPLNHTGRSSYTRAYQDAVACLEIERQRKEDGKV